MPTPEERKAPPAGLLYMHDTEAGPGIASRLGITVSTYKKWRLAGKGPHAFRLGKNVVAYITDVDAYIADQAQAARQPAPEMRPPEPRTPHGGRPRKTAARKPATAGR